MKPLPRKPFDKAQGSLPDKTVSVTFQADGVTVVIRQGKKAHIYESPAHRERLLVFCLDKRFARVERGLDLTIYRNWN